MGNHIDAYLPKLGDCGDCRGEMALSRQLPGQGRRTGRRCVLGRGRSRVSAAPVRTFSVNRTVDRAASPHTRMGLTMSLAVFASFCGVDVSERQLDVHLLPEGVEHQLRPLPPPASAAWWPGWPAASGRCVVVEADRRARARPGRGPGPGGHRGGRGQSAPDPRLRPRRRPAGQDRPARRAGPGAVRRAHAAGAAPAGQRGRRLAGRPGPAAPPAGGAARRRAQPPPAHRRAGAAALAGRPSGLAHRRRSRPSRRRWRRGWRRWRRPASAPRC